MSVKPIIPSIETNNNTNKIKINRNNQNKNNVSFGGTNFIVDSMNFIEKGGYVASFCIQDGLGFVFPRVGGGLIRGKSQKKDKEGNPVYNGNGNPVYEYNWKLARKEFLRELITGPSAFVIPWLSFKGIKKVASGNNVKLNYIDGFNDAFTDYVKTNAEALKAGKAPKEAFYQKIFENVINESVNNALPDAEKMSAEEVKAVAQDYTKRQIQIETLNSDRTISRKVRNERLSQIEPVEDSFMRLKKSKLGGIVDELSVNIKSSDGKVRGGSISELLTAMNDYFSDAVKNTQKTLSQDAGADISKVVKSFTHRRMGTRVLTNLGLFGIVAAFYTQIPKLYNAGLKDNPALKGTVADKSNTGASASENNKDVSFTGLGSLMEKTGKGVFGNKISKYISDIFEFNGNTISSMAMPVLLYGFCIPPRLQKAQDKYDYGEIVLRDMTSFTALLFGGKALSRLFSDVLTKHTGLALNRKDMDGRSLFKKVIDYLSPVSPRHNVLSSKELNSKYTNLEEYKGGVNGFIEYIENSHGNIKKAFTWDKNVKLSVENILKDYNGKSYAQATAQEIKAALKAADAKGSVLIKNFYDLFKNENGLLKAAKTCNSSFNFISSFVLIPGLIIWLTHACEKMTKRRTAEDMQKKELENSHNNIPQNLDIVASNVPTMAGFLNNK